MKKVVVIADTKWSIHRVHQGIERALAGEYTFTYYESSSFDMQAFLKDFREADVCLSCIVYYRDMQRVIPDRSDLKKIILVCHGVPDLYDVPTSECIDVFTYGVTSHAHESIIKARVGDNPVYVVPNGVDPTQFTYRERPGTIQMMGWCGATNIPSKRIEWANQISELTSVPLTVASTLTPEEVKTWYETIDILLVTAGPDATAETGPLPPFEAIVSGVLAIGTPVGNFASLPGPKFTTIEEAVTLIQELRSDPERVKRLAREQYECVMREWTYDTTKEKWRTMFSAVSDKINDDVHK